MHFCAVSLRLKRVRNNLLRLRDSKKINPNACNLYLNVNPVNVCFSGSTRRVGYMVKNYRINMQLVAATTVNSNCITPRLFSWPGAVDMKTEIESVTALKDNC